MLLWGQNSVQLDKGRVNSDLKRTEKSSMKNIIRSFILLGLMAISFPLYAVEPKYMVPEYQARYRAYLKYKADKQKSQGDSSEAIAMLKKNQERKERAMDQARIVHIQKRVSEKEATQVIAQQEALFKAKEDLVERRMKEYALSRIRAEKTIESMPAIPENIESGLEDLSFAP
jgi:hypothetical protein